jgi:hypothetical protein
MRTTSHRARAIVATLAASLALVTVIGPVAGTEPRPQAVTIVSPMTVPGNPNYGFFTASGSPLICASGDVIDTRLVVLRGSLESDFVLTVNKTFTCHDGSGTFFARLLVRMSGGVETFTCHPGRHGEVPRPLRPWQRLHRALRQRGRGHEYLHRVPRHRVPRPLSCAAGRQGGARVMPRPVAMRLDT